MDVVGRLVQVQERLLRRIGKNRAALSRIPRGSATVKVIGGHSYLYIGSREGGKHRTRYYAPYDMRKAASLRLAVVRRREIRRQIRDDLGRMRNVLKALTALTTVSGGSLTPSGALDVNFRTVRMIDEIRALNSK